MKNTPVNRIFKLPLLAALVIFCITACQKSEGLRKPLSDDPTKPGVVTNVQVKNFNGGAYVSYTLPASENFLYVLAEYKINDTKTRQTKASYYVDSLVVEGFQKSQEYEVTLYAVSRADVKSDPVVIKVHPDTPYYLLIKKSIQVKPDFGGINVTALNEARRSVSINMVAIEPANNKLEIQDQHFTDVDSIDYSLRGYPAEPAEFGFFVTDQFGNISDTMFVTTTPYFEILLDKKKFKTYKLPSDSQVGYGWEVLYLWDDKTDGSSPGWHTTGGTVPIQCTFDMGQTAKLSHFMLWERPDGSVYGYGEPKNFVLWGSASDAPADAAMPAHSAQGTIVGDWVNLGNYRFPDPPSGLPIGSTNASDEAFVEQGVNFNVSLNNPKVKFIRFMVVDTWGGVDYTHMMELSFYGTP